MAKSLVASLHHTIGFHLMNGVGQGVRAELVILFDRAGRLRTVSGNAAGKTEARDGCAVAVGDGNGFHDASGAGNIDLPHAVNIENTGSQRVEHKGEVDDGAGTGLIDKLDELADGTLAAEIQGFEAFDRGVLRRAHVNAENP